MEAPALAGAFFYNDPVNINRHKILIDGCLYLYPAKFPLHEEIFPVVRAAVFIHGPFFPEYVRLTA